MTMAQETDHTTAVRAEAARNLGIPESEGTGNVHVGFPQDDWGDIAYYQGNGDIREGTWSVDERGKIRIDWEEAAS